MLAQFGGLPTPVAVLAMLLLAGYLALYPAAAAAVTARLLARLRRPRTVARARGLGRHRVHARRVLRGLSLGAARQQPGGGAADRAAGQRGRRLRPVGPGRRGERGRAGGVSVERPARVGSPWAPAVLWPGSGGRLGLLAHRPRRLLEQAPPLRVGLVQANIAQADKWDPRQARRIFTTYIAMTRDAVKRGARVRDLAGVVHARDVRGRRGRVKRCATWPGRCVCRCSSAAISSSAAPSRALYNVGVPGQAGRTHRGRLPQDPAGAVRRVLPVPALAVVRVAARRRAGAVCGRRRGGDAAGRLAPGKHGDLLRGGVPAPGARGRAGGQRAADDDHQRRVVWRDVGALSAFRAWRRCAQSSRAGTWRGPPTPASAASSTPTAASCTRSRMFEQTGHRGGRAIHPGTDDLRGDRRRGAVGQRGPRCGGARGRPPSSFGSPRAGTAGEDVWQSASKIWSGGTKDWCAAPPSCGGIFDGARLDDQLAEIEAGRRRTALLEQSAARRRRSCSAAGALEEDSALRDSLRRRADDLAVLFEWAATGRGRRRRSRARARRAPDRRSKPPRCARCSAASTTAPTPS